jgi:hypothetical protein
MALGHLSYGCPRCYNWRMDWQEKKWYSEDILYQLTPAS